MLAQPPATVRRRTPADVSIRRAESADFDALVDIENAAFATDRLSARQLRQHLDSLTAEILVATCDRRVVGTAVLFFRRASDVARLYSIAVATSERGRGIGEALLDAAERSARKRGSAVLRLEVRVDNRAAQLLYERQGYSRFGLRRTYYEDGADALRYEKPLRVAATT